VHRGEESTVTLLEGACFCISSRAGDIVPGGQQGLYFLDTRFLSELSLLLDGAEPELLDVVQDEPFAATFIARAAPNPGAFDSTLLVERHRRVGEGLREELVIRNLAEEASYVKVELRVGADFADVADVRGGKTVEPAEQTSRAVTGGLELQSRRGAQRRGLRALAPGATPVDGATLAFEAIVPARSVWRTCVEIVPVVDGEEVEPRHRCGDDDSRDTSVERLERWRRILPAIETDHAVLRQVLARSAEDLGSLRVFDPEVPERAVIAAGAPWSMGLFGRDSLLTAWMALLVDPELALGVLETLARFQGTDIDPRTEEEPGRILHSLRFGSGQGLASGGRPQSFGSIDATPLFVMLLGELRRWGLAPELVERLLPHADRALQWIADFGDRDGDGYVEYQRATDRGRLHQSWRDASDAMRTADGDVAHPPIAPAEVQGYVYAAYRARAHFAREAGDTEGAARWGAKAAELRAAFNRDFWVEEQGYVAIALDHEKRPLDGVSSTAGHCLWTGILDEDKAALVTARLMSPDLFSGWGVRTLAKSMTGYNPISYQNGSVWPHDNAITAAGLMRYGYVAEAQQLIMSMLDAAGALGGRLPELFAGFDRTEVPFPVSYPSSCSPQAWAAAAPLLFLRTLLRFEPWIPNGQVRLAPVLPDVIGRLRIEGVPLLGASLSIEVDGEHAKVEGVPPGVDVVSEPRAPLG
jgi:glycogen debranching enzyme